MADEENLSRANEGGVFVAASSITKNCVISGQKQVEMFSYIKLFWLYSRRYLYNVSH